MPREAKVPIPHSMWVEDLIYICSHLISPCCSTCWSVVFRFSISSPGDFISFPHLFDHFIKRIWSVIQIYLISLSHKKHVSHLFVHYIVWFHQLSQVFPIYFSSWSLQFVFSSLKFSQPIGACYHWVSSVFPTYFLSSSWCFMSFGCLFLHCIIRFHQSSSPKSSLYHSFSSVFSQLLVTRFDPFSPTTCSFYHWRSSFCPSIPWFYHEISISFPHLFVHLLTRFHQFSPHPGSFNHWFLLGVSISSFYPWISSCSRPIAMCVLCIIFSNLSIISSI